MSSLARPLAVMIASAVLLIGPLTNPAAAVTRSETSVDESASSATDAVQLAADAGITATVTFRPDPGSPAEPLEDVTVTLYRLDEAAGYYIPVETSTGPITQGQYVSPALEPGAYAIRFVADPFSGIGSEYFEDARYFYESTDVVLDAGETVALGTVVLEPRYFDVGRIAGVNRFETAVAISRQIVADGERAPVVYITNAYNYPDALAAGPAAIRAGGVILSTDRMSLPDVVGQRLQQMNPVRVVILGDGNSVSAAVEQSIRALVPGSQVDRLGGPNRFATAELIVRDAFESTGSPFAIIATGNNYPDALAAGPAAGWQDAPVILVNGAGELDGATRALLDDLGVTDAIIVGGLPSVGAALESGLEGELRPDHVGRLAGADRYETASMINEELIGESDYAFLTTGTNFADALTGGPLAGAVGAPLYLATPTCVPSRVADGFVVKQVAGVWLYGSEASLAASVEDLTIC